MSQRTCTQRRTWRERAISLLLAAALLAGLTPGLTLPASADHWADAYLDQLVDWGFIRADQTADPDAELTRAEFVAVINRAYNYTESGPIPFVDVVETDWFYDDVSIAYTAGYMKGTSETTASPYSPLTREQAVCILGRNMMMKETPGENLAFSDSRDISDWARGTVKTAVDNYIISGYPDNTFQPQGSISKGQMAVLITQCVGTPIQESGEYELGGVFGNVTITSPDVILRNTTISGDLYVSGGVGLGGIKLENVDVLGRIIVSATGESEGGEASVIMRNVTAAEMLVDNMRDKTVTVRADGITNIANTVVRTNAYLEDNNTDNEGLLHIELNGAPGLRLTLAGRIKEVVNKTPGSTIQVAKGTVAKLTADEAATGSTVQIDRNTKVTELNLDVSTNVLGDGDIGQLNVNAPGSVVSMVPDKIYIRPGLNATIAGVIMDYQAAEEGSLDPRLLSGYPAAKDIAPTGFRADFATNKKGTVYWAVSYVSDGSIGEDALISPPSYGNKAIVNGSVAAPAGGDEVSAQISNLVVGGSYYLSAIVVDEQNNRSPVKVISFSTPDNSVPAFAQGYPYMSRNTDTVAQVTVMPTKSCKLYYALLPKGAQAPTVNDLKAAAVTGNLGYGVRDVTKNTEDVFTVNNQRLEELKDYVLYLWLTDADGANSSKIVTLSFKTPDSTRPNFVPETGADLSGDPGATNVPLVVGLDEPGTVYWVAVPRGTAYPLPHNGVDADNVQDASGVLTASLTSLYAKNQVRNGRGGGAGSRSGSVRITNANTATPMNITGLARETAYDLYYVAVDNAGAGDEGKGWYSAEVKKLSIHTLDQTPPTVKQYFSLYAGTDNTRSPRVTTDIILDFSEDIASYSGKGNARSLLDIWKDISSQDAATRSAAERDFYDLLSNTISLYEVGTGSSPVRVSEWPEGTPTEPPAPWINLRRAMVTSENGHVILTLPYNDTNPALSAHHLRSGVTYYFEFQDIKDTSGNRMNPARTYHLDMGESYVPTFTTVFAQVYLSSPAPSDSRRPIIRDFEGIYEDNRTVIASDTDPGNPAVIDYTFRMVPEATGTVDVSYSYDLQLFTGAAMAFDLYCRIKPNTAGANYITSIDGAKEVGILARDKGDANDWLYLGNSGDVYPPNNTAEGLRGVSVNGAPTMGNQSVEYDFPQISSLKQGYIYEFVISLTKLDNTTERAVWSADKVKMEVHVMAGGSNLLGSNAVNLTEAKRESNTGDDPSSGKLVSIGQTQDFKKFLELEQSFANSRAPRFNVNYPKITPGDSFVDVQVSLDQKGTIYYVIAPVDEETEEIRTVVKGQSWTGKDLWDHLPKRGQNTQQPGSLSVDVVYKDDIDGMPIELEMPRYSDIITLSQREENIGDRQPYTQDNVRAYLGYKENGVTGLAPLQKYIIYFVLMGESGSTSDVFAYAFETNDSQKPAIGLGAGNGTVGISISGKTQPDDVRYILLTIDNLGLYDSLKFLNEPLVVDPEIATALPAGYSSGPNKVTTVLDALCEPYTYLIASNSRTNNDNVRSTDDKYDGYSVFDLYAIGNQRDKVKRLIDGDSASLAGAPFEDLGSVRLTLIDGGTYWGNAKLEIEAGDTEYVFLCMTHHIASDSSDLAVWSFAGSKPVKKMNTEAPELLSVGCSGDPTPNNTSSNAYVELTFTKPLYWKNLSGTKFVVDQSDDTTTIDGEPHVGILYGYENDRRLSPYMGVKRGQTIQFKIKYTGFKSGDSVDLLVDGSFCESGGNTHLNRKILKLIFVEGTPRTNKPNDSNTETTRLYCVAEWGGVRIAAPNVDYFS